MRMHYFFVSFVVAMCIWVCGISGIHITSAHAASNTHPSSKVYYVATTGSDKNPGTINRPWKTLQHAADVVKPGSVVYVRGGVYHQKLKITRSGSKAAGPITFASYPSETAVLDGTGLSVGDTDEGLIDIHDASYIKIKGFDIRNFTTSKRGHVPVGILVHGSGSHISLLDNKVHAIKNTAEPDSNLNGRDAHGIAVYGTEAPASINHIVIKGNELYNLVLGSSESLVVNGNVNNFSIIGNKVHDNDNIGIDAIGYEGTSPDPAYDYARNGKIIGNTVYNISSNNNPSYGKNLPNNSNGADGIYVDGGKNILIARNDSHNNDIGIEAASEHKGKTASNITIRNNIVYKNHWAGVSIGGYDTQRGSTVNCKIIYNLLYKNGTMIGGGPQLALQYDTRNNIIEHNVMVAGKYNLLIGNPFTLNIGNTVDYNLYSASGGASGAKWIWKNKEYDGFSAYKKGTGNDTHSLFVPSKFVNRYIQSGSLGDHAKTNDLPGLIKHLRLVRQHNR